MMNGMSLCACVWFGGRCDGIGCREKYEQRVFFLSIYFKLLHYMVFFKNMYVSILKCMSIVE